MNPLQPLVKSGVVGIREALTGIDAMKQGKSSMVCGYPDSVGVGDLIIDPGERAPS